MVYICRYIPAKGTQYRISGLLISQPDSVRIYFRNETSDTVEDTGKQHEDHIYRFSPGIKDQTAQKQQQIAELSRYQVVDQHENRKKAEYKKYTVEYHIKSSPIWIL